MLYKYDEVDSTQDALKELYANERAQFGDAVVALTQTAGRGRFGKSFYSPPKSGIYLSVLLPYDNSELLTVGAAVAVLQAIEKVTGQKADVKWVNDVYLDGKKIAGILAEAIVDKDGKPAAVILGVGINVVSPINDFPEDIKDRVGALIPGNYADTLSITGLDSLREQLTSSLLECLFDLTLKIRDKTFFNEYKARMLNPQDVPPGVLE